MKQSLKVIQLIHFSLLMSVLLFFGVIVVINGFATDMEITKDLYLFFGIAIASVMMAAVMSRVIPNQLWSRINEEDSSETKFGQYLTGAIVQYALLEGSLLICLVFYLLHGHVFFILFAAAPMYLLIMNRPSAENVSQHAKINYSEFH